MNHTKWATFTWKKVKCVLKGKLPSDILFQVTISLIKVIYSITNSCVSGVKILYSLCCRLFLCFLYLLYAQWQFLLIMCCQEFTSREFPLFPVDSGWSRGDLLSQPFNEGSSSCWIPHTTTITSIHVSLPHLPCVWCSILTKSTSHCLSNFFNFFTVSQAFLLWL